MNSKIIFIITSVLFWSFTVFADEGPVEFCSPQKALKAATAIAVLNGNPNANDNVEDPFAPPGSGGIKVKPVPSTSSSELLLSVTIGDDSYLVKLVQAHSCIVKEVLLSTYQRQKL